jgi:hypothetical protein
MKTQQDYEIEIILVNEMRETEIYIYNRFKRLPTKQEYAKMILVALYEHDLIAT